MMHIKKSTGGIALVISLAATLSISVQPALAYISPEEVLLSDELFLPPRTREALERTERQQRTSASRREREQALIFETQRAAEEEEVAFESAPTLENIDSFDTELLRTLRLLERIDDRQRYLRYAGDTLHGGAPLASQPDLAPTGAGGILTALVMVLAVGWTLHRARKAEKGV